MPWRRFTASSAATGEITATGLRPLRLLSFEHDLDPLTLAAKHSGYFPHLHHSAPSKILSQGSWQHPSEMLHWQLLQGDFRDLIETRSDPRPDFLRSFLIQNRC